MMKRNVWLFVLLMFITGKADEVLLKNGQVWKNVNILEDLETYNAITIYTSRNKKIIIYKKDIAGIKLAKFNPRKKSELVFLEPDQRKDFQDLEATPRIPAAAASVVQSPSPLDTMLQSFPKMRINVEGGYSYRTVKVPSGIPTELKNYINDLKKGFNLSVDLAYYFHREYGVGIHFSYASSASFMDNIYYINELTGESGVGSMKDDIALTFVGFGITHRKLIGAGNMLMISNITVGPLLYNDDARFIDFYMDIEGSTLALHGLFGVDYLLSERLGIGVSLSYVLGSLDRIKVNGKYIHLEEKENLNRYDLNLGLRYYF